MTGGPRTSDDLDLTCPNCGTQLESRLLVRFRAPALTYWPCSCGVSRLWFGDASDVAEDFDF